MIDQEMLDAISKMMEKMLEKMLDKKLDEKLDEKLAPINQRLEIMEIKQKMTHKKLNDLALDVKFSERDVRNDIHGLQDAQDTLIAVMEAKDILPRVGNL